MTKIQNLIAAELRLLLAEETKDFIEGLDTCSFEVLQDKKARIQEIRDLLRIDETKKASHIAWGKNATELAKIIPITDAHEQLETDGESESNMSELA
jgi:hypothetical protein